MKKEELLLALKPFDHDRRDRLQMAVPNLRKLVMATNEKFSILERLIIVTSSGDKSTILILSGTLQTPHLRHLVLIGFALPMRSRVLTTAMGLITLALVETDRCTRFRPNTLLQWLSFMPQLETLLIVFLYAVFDYHVEKQLTHTSMTTPSHFLTSAGLGSEAIACS
jgi:hypothetical protein